jgi:hypothetical protein
MGLVYLIFYLMSLLSVSQAFSMVPEVRIGSSYQDKKTFELQRFTGRALFLRAEINQSQRYFLLTASHVSQGQELNVDIDVKPVGRLANTLFDLELIEVVPNNLPNDFLQSLPWIEPQSGLIFAIRGISSENIRNIGFSGLREQGHWLISDEVLPKGASGMPIFSHEGYLGQHLSLIGLYLSSERYFPRSFFASRHAISKIVRAYFAGERGQMENLEWSLRHGLLTRSSEIVQEAMFLVSAAGRGMRGDGGRGMRGDGGTSTNEVKTDLSLMNWLAVQRSGGHFSADPSQEFSVDFSMAIQNEPVIAFVQSCGNQGQAYLAAEWENYAKYHAKIHNTQPYQVVLDGAGLLVELRRRLSAVLMREINVSDTVNMSLVNGVRYNSSVALSFSFDRLRISYKDSDGDHFTAELDNRGVQFGKSKFEPVLVLVGDRSGHRYFIDLRELFFTGTKDISNPCGTYSSRVDISIRRETDHQISLFRTEI